MNNLHGTSSNDRWLPLPIESYANAIKIPCDTDDNKRLRKNFAYSMQYIEYLEQQLIDIRLTDVLKKMVYKSYIITGMGIVELLLVYLLKSNSQWSQDEWVELESYTANPKQINNDTIKVTTTLYKKVEKFDKVMDLHSMLKRAEKKHTITLDHNDFPALKKLRELRNRVHLHLGEGAYGHDYNTISVDDIQLMRKILYEILTAPEVCYERNVFDFRVSLKYWT